MEFVNKKWSKNVLPEKLKNIQVIEVEENNCVLTTSDFFAVIPSVAQLAERSAVDSA